MLELIPAFIIGVFSAVLFLMIEKISDKRIRHIAPALIAGIFVVFSIIADESLLSATSSGIFFGLIQPFLVIAVFDTIREKLTIDRKWLVIVIVSGIVTIFFAIQAFLTPESRIPGFSTDTYLVIILAQTFEVILISAASYGTLLFIQKPEDPSEMTPWISFRRMIVAAALLFFTPFLFTGGLAVYLFSLLQRIKRAIIFLVASLSVAVVFAFAGDWLETTQVYSLSRDVGTFFLIMVSVSLVILALTILLKPILKKTWVLSILLYGSILTGLVGEFIASLVELVSSQKIAMLPSVIIWFASSLIAFFIIFCIVQIKEKRRTFQLHDLIKSRKIEFALTVLAVIVICSVIFYAGEFHSAPGKDWKRAVSPAPFGDRQDYSLAEWNGSLWVIGGSDRNKNTNDTWFSSDGITWRQITPLAAFEARSRQSVVVFDNKLWVIGGMTSIMNRGTGRWSENYKNDVWYSTDGKTWTLATPQAAFPPTQYFGAIAYDNKIWIFSESGVWQSYDGINWTQTQTALRITGNGVNSAVKNNQLWIVATGVGNRLWNSRDGSVWSPVTTPPFSNEKYSSNTYANILVVDDKIWLFRSSKERDTGKWHSEIWNSDDGGDWNLVTDSPAYTRDIEFYVEFKPIVHDNKIWAFMIRVQKDMSITEKYTENLEIWYTDIPLGEIRVTAL